MTELINKAIGIAQTAETRKKEIESLRNLPTDIVDQLKTHGLVKMWARKEIGGKQLAVSTTSKLIAAMAYHNASLAWVTAVTNCSSLITGFIPDSMASKLYGTPDAMIGGFAGPAGIATVDKDTLIVRGRWSWGSGIAHCTHIVGGIRIMEGDTLKGTGVAFFLPGEIQMIDNWEVMGLKGTNSIDYTTKGTILSKDRWTPFPVAAPTVDAPLYRFSFLGALSISVASVGLGLANRAVHEIKEIAQSKRPFGQGKILAHRSNFQERFGQVSAKYNAAKAYFEGTIAKAEKEVEKGPCSLASKAALRLAAAYTTELAADVVATCYQLAGGSAIWNTGKLEELFRDCNVVTQHGMVNASNYRTGGSVDLGLPVPEVIL